MDQLFGSDVVQGHGVVNKADMDQPRVTRFFKLRGLLTDALDEVVSTEAEVESIVTKDAFLLLCQHFVAELVDPPGLEDRHSVPAEPVLRLLLQWDDLVRTPHRDGVHAHDQDIDSFSNDHLQSILDVGEELVEQLQLIMSERQGLPSPSYRKLFFVAHISIALCYESQSVVNRSSTACDTTQGPQQRSRKTPRTALECLDRCIVLGAPQQCRIAADLIEGSYAVCNPLADAPHGWSLSDKIKISVLRNFPRLMPCGNRICEAYTVRDESPHEWRLRFQKEFFTPRKAVVIRVDHPHALSRGWIALETWRSMQYIASHIGHRTIPVEIGRHHEPSNAVAWQEKFMLVNDFMSIYMGPSLRRILDETTSHSEKYDQGSNYNHAGPKENCLILPPPETVGYIAQHKLFQQLPHFQRDLAPLPHSLCSLLNKGAGIRNINVWLGTDRTVTPLHFHRYHNFLFQVVGYKYVRLYEQTENEFLYLTSINNTSTLSTMNQNNICPVDVERVDMERYPLFRKARYTDIILGPGDALFIPQAVWHYVRSITPSFSVNFWF